MTNILLSGALGKMGRTIADAGLQDDEISIICGVDCSDGLTDFPLYKSFSEVTELPDVIVDFSNVAALDDILSFATSHNTAVVLATTGYSDLQINSIKQASAHIPVFFSSNMSLGINLLCSIVKKAANVLGNTFDIEIIEKHHNQKIDAPSGTAIMLANAVNSEFDDKYVYEYDRHSKRSKRRNNEIGIHSVRGGTIVGEHDVIFAGKDEVITFSHTAQSKLIFANGALTAAKYIKNKPCGLYDMNDVLNLD